MILPKTILRGYDKTTEKLIAQALGIKINKKKHHGRVRHVKIPVSAIKKHTKMEKKSEKSKKKGMKASMFKAKKKEANDE